MSAKSCERRQKFREREQAQKNKPDVPASEAKENEYIRPITIHPIDYHDIPPQASAPPCAQPDPTVQSHQAPAPDVPFADLVQSQFIKKRESEVFDFSDLVKERPKVNVTDVLNDWTSAMRNALTPRTEDGTLLKELPVGQISRAKIPVFAPPANPSPERPFNPFVYPEDFADGKSPEDLCYVDGYVVGTTGPDGKPMVKEIFDDPVRNLSGYDQTALDLGRRMQQSPIAVPSAAPAEPQKLPPSLLASQSDNNLDMVVDSPRDGCLVLNTKKGPVKLTNFRVFVQECHQVIGKQYDAPPTAEYLVQILCGSITRSITLTPQELDNAVRKIQYELPACIIHNSSGMKVHQAISNYLRQQLLDAPLKVYVERTGFLKLADRWVYVHDRAVPPDPGTVFQTGRCIPDTPGVSDAQAFDNALMFLDITHKDELIIPLFLLAHLGPLFQLFQEAKRTPRFVTVLAGRSGSLKTSMALVLFRLFADQDQTPTASFRDTETAFEIKLGELGGSVGIFDDFRPPVSDLKSKANAEKLESLIRAVGDHVAKSRSNVKLGRAREFLPSGCALVTAEDLSGSQSSYLRSLILSIAKNDVNGNKLRFFQNHPDIIPTHMNRFLRWAGQHGDELIGHIRNDFPSGLFQDTVTELRLVDTAATLMMVAQLIASYAQACGAMTGAEAEAFQTRCCHAVSTAIAASEALSKDANPCVMYLEALFSLMDRGEIRLAENMKLYTPEFHDGFLSDQCAWLDADVIYTKVCRFHSRVNVTFPLSERQLAVHLADAELIAVASETRKDGTPKRLFRRKSSLPTRKAMQVLHLDRATLYLEEHGNH